MTLPTRPAPAPPGSRAQVAAATANASLEQLRLQLQQQQELQRQNVSVPKLSIKLPPPPKGPHQSATTINGFGATTNGNGVATPGGSGSITRKFPQARYAPATNWDDSPFDILSGSVPVTNGNYKKPPPPRPPPPKIQPKKQLAPTPPVQPSSNSILSNIFHRKKSSRAPTSNSASRIYGAATGGGGNGSSNTTTATSHNTQMQQSSQHNSWNNAWNSHSSFTTTSATTQSTTVTDGQLISFDSPPSSPTFTQKSNSDCLSVDSFSSDSNFSSPNNGSVSQPESGFEDDFSAAARSRPATTSPLDPWETIDAFGPPDPAATATATQPPRYGSVIGTAPVRNLNAINTRVQTNGDNPLCNGKSLLPPAPTLNMPTIIKPKISQKPKAPKPPTLGKPNGMLSFNSDLPTPPSPPMPQCAPPPPPGVGTAYSSGSTRTVSILDVISGKVDAIHLESYGSGGGQLDNYGSALNEQPYGIALYDFESTEEGDLCFRENEKIYLLEQVSETWLKGRTRSGCEGIFPVNYIEIKVPLSAKTTTNVSNTIQQPPSSDYSTTSIYNSATTTTYQSTSTRDDFKVRCLYNFPAEVEGDLEIKENEMVNILYRINEDWLYGELNGRQGQFPANFLEYLPSNIPMP